MYDTFWGLRSRPFQPDAANGYFYLSPTHDEATARLDYLINNRRRLGILIGEAGTGKTRLLRWYANQLRRHQHHVGVVSMLGVDLQEFLWRVAESLYAKPERGDSTFTLWRRINHLLFSHRYADGQVVLLLDDADEAQREVIDCVTRLIHFEPTPSLRLTLVLAAEPERVLRLGKRILDYSDLHIELESWTIDEVRDYLRNALHSAGRETPILNAEATARLYDKGQGNPRLTAKLADLALLAGAAQQLPEVCPTLIDEVHQELLSKQTVAPVNLC